MKIWAVIDITHFEVVKVFGSEESADYYATYKNAKDHEDYFIYEEFEVDERLDDLYDFTDEDSSCLESATPPMYLAGDAYAKSDSAICALRRKTISAMASRINTVYCVTKVLDKYISVNFYRSEYIANKAFLHSTSRYPDAKNEMLDGDEDRPVAVIQFHGHFVEE
uniref:Uncharacterized protein n=1 Tax=Siphoviridae sp. ctgBD49 TaxID=2826420 RepID=A0A8S5QNY0_9CAUD|nr:MAG TPA: hypothetical protein [Siphoviridae sp. ctgBD49]